MVSAPSARRLLRCWTPVGGSSIITLRRARSSGDGTATLATYAADWSERMLSIAPQNNFSPSFDAERCLFSGRARRAASRSL